jgi:RND family efflux transporter MFP subunit
MRLTRASWAALLLLGLAGCRSADGREELPPPSGSGAPPPLALPAVASAATPASSSAADQLVVTGTATPVREAKVGPKTTGTVAAMQVEEGDTVKKGQLLFRLSGANQALAVKQAQAALASAMVGQTTAKTEFDRIKALHERGSVAPATFDQVKAQYDAAQAGVDQARAAVASARQATADTAVLSPISGVVSKRLASVGDTVSMMPPTVVLIIQDISELEVRGRVPETMLAKLKPGSSIRVRFPAVKQERTVKIERISPSVDPMTRTIEVVALVPNEDRSLKAGMLVELDFTDTSERTSSPAPSASVAPTAKRKTEGK